MAGVGVVADTSPLVAFAKLDRLDLLGLLFATVLIPPTVEHELTAKRSTESRRLQLAIGTLLQVTEPPEFVPVVRAATLNMDIGFLTTCSQVPLQLPASLNGRADIRPANLRGFSSLDRDAIQARKKIFQPENARDLGRKNFPLAWSRAPFTCASGHPVFADRGRSVEYYAGAGRLV